ncbi:MAG: hypothetical protein QOE30_2555 [Mycobacterium sp.]|jgi:hypothetical protein|nr:hypothetical protein [Mycobacterium sp.]
MANGRTRSDWEALTGIAFVALCTIAAAIRGEPLKTDAAAADVVRYFTEKRSQVLESSAVWFLAVILLLWFFGVLRSRMRGTDAGDRLTATAFGGGIFGAAFLTASSCGLNAAALEIARTGAEPLAVRGFYDLAGAFFAMSGIGFAVFYWATALAGIRNRSLPSWLCWFAVAAGAIQLLYAIGLMASHGPLANGGSLGIVEPLFSMCWFAVVSVVLFRKPQPEPASNR